MIAKEKQPVKPLKIETIENIYNTSVLDIGPEELKEKQRSDTTLKSKPVSDGKPQFVVQYRKA